MREMKIYFACSITGGRKNEAAYRAIVDELLAAGHEVPTAHLSRSDVVALEVVVDPQEVYARDVGWISSSDAVIAEVSTPSHGVGYEIAFALSKGKPVLCCYRKGFPVSKMITGNSDPNIDVQAYTSAKEAVQIVCGFLEKLKNQ
jgi:nucleoside 2-deoxyribosyltransferase